MVRKSLIELHTSSKIRWGQSSAQVQVEGTLVYARWSGGKAHLLKAAPKSLVPLILPAHLLWWYSYSLVPSFQSQTVLILYLSHPPHISTHLSLILSPIQPLLTTQSFRNQVGMLTCVALPHPFSLMNDPPICGINVFTNLLMHLPVGSN